MLLEDFTRLFLGCKVRSIHYTSNREADLKRKLISVVPTRRPKKVAGYFMAVVVSVATINVSTAVVVIIAMSVAMVTAIVTVLGGHGFVSNPTPIPSALLAYT
jgi:hypothetical protein